MSARPNEEFRAALVEALGEENIVKGTAVLGEGPDFVFAMESRETPTLYVDDEAAGRMRPIRGTPLWYSVMKLETGRSHSFYYLVGSERRGGRTAHHRPPGQGHAVQAAEEGAVAGAALRRSLRERPANGLTHRGATRLELRP